MTITNKAINKAALGLATVLLSAVAVAGPKTYDLILDETAMAGATQLEPGHYSLKLAGSSAVFTDARTRKEFTVPVKVENSDKKYSLTEMDTIKQAGGEKITAIELGGSKTKLDFGQ